MKTLIVDDTISFTEDIGAVYGQDPGTAFLTERQIVEIGSREFRQFAISTSLETGDVPHPAEFLS
jgi:hypothetical protein